MDDKPLLLRAQDPTYLEVRRLEEVYFNQRRIADAEGLAASLRAQGEKEVGIRGLVASIYYQRDQLAGDLEELAETIREAEPKRAQLILDTAKQIRPTDKNWHKYNELADEPYTGENNQDRKISAYGTAIRGPIGELRLALLEEDILVKTNVSVAKELEKVLPKTSDGKIDRAALAGTPENILLDTQVDCVLNDGRTIWAEVKYKFSVMHRGHRDWNGTLEQAKHLLKAMEIVRANDRISDALKNPAELRFYFINGIELRAAEELEALGVQVLGPRFAEVRTEASSVALAH